MAAFSFCIVVNILAIRIFFNNFLKTISCTLILLQFTMMPSVYSIVDQTRSFPFFPKDAFFFPWIPLAPGRRVTRLPASTSPDRARQLFLHFLTKLVRTVLLEMPKVGLAWRVTLLTGRIFLKVNTRINSVKANNQSMRSENWPFLMFTYSTKLEIRKFHIV